MSPPTTDPYKSKLFNFLNRQSLQWRDRLGVAARQLKVAVEWGVQILLYPAYLVVQTGRLVGNKLRKPVDRAKLTALDAQTEPQPRSLTVDRPIEKVLQVVTSLEELTLTQLEIESSSTLKKVVQQLNQNRLSIKGIASCVETRALVLVTADNQVLNLLSEEQQHQLQQLISWEVANYWYERRFGHNQSRPWLGLLPGKSKGLLVVRRFQQLIRWEQTSPLAITLNLFQEADLNRIRSSDLEDKEPDPFQIQVLIQAAIDYLFGHCRRLFQVKTKPTQVKINNSQLLASEEDLWLSWEDLFSEPAPTEVQNLEFRKYPTRDSPKPTELPNSAKVIEQPNTPLRPRIKWTLFENKSASTPSPNPTKFNKLAKAQESSQKIVHSGERPATSTAPLFAKNSLDQGSDWIETEASPVGYVKHPLERILAWLDRIILWLEKAIAKIWLWLRQKR